MSCTTNHTFPGPELGGAGRLPDDAADAAADDAADDAAADDEALPELFCLSKNNSAAWFMISSSLALFRDAAA